MNHHINAKLIVSISLVIALATGTPEDLFAGSGELLVCRGGGNMNVFFSAYRGDGTGTGKRAVITMYVEFQKNFKSFGNGQLRPGQCSWKNRTFNRNEPSELIMIGKYKWMIMSFFIQKKRNSWHKSNYKSKFEKIIRDIREGRLFYLRVKPQRHGNKNYLGISGYGPK